MADVEAMNEFLARITPTIVTELELDVGTRNLLVFEDAKGIEIADVSSSPVAPHELVASLVDGGAVGAAYASYLPDRAEVIAQILVGDPRRSDVRRAKVDRGIGGVTLGPWEYAITG